MIEKWEQLAIDAFFDDETNRSGQRMTTFGHEKMKLYADLVVKECLQVCKEELDSETSEKLHKTLHNHFNISNR